MTALIIIGAVILLIAVLLNIRLRAEIKFYGGELDFKVKYLWFTVFPLKVREKKNKRGKKAKKSKRTSESSDVTVKNENSEASESPVPEAGEAAEDDETLLKGDTKAKKEKKKLSDSIGELGDMIEKAKIVWSFSKKWLVHIFKHIYVSGLVIDFKVSGEDAYKAAMNYGSVNAVTYGALSLVSTLFTVKIGTVDIVCDFDGKKSVFDGEVNVALSPGTALKAAFGILLGILKNIKVLKGEKPAQESSTFTEARTA